MAKINYDGTILDLELIMIDHSTIDYTPMGEGYRVVEESDFRDIAKAIINYWVDKGGTL